MESIAEKLLVLVPGAFVVIITLVICLRHTTTNNERWIEAHKETSKKSTDATDRASVSIEKNTEMLGRISGILTRIENGGPGGH